MGEPQPDLTSRSFGRFLRELRERRRYSLDAVAEMSSGYPERITKSHLSRIENGKAIPTFPKLMALSGIYDVPITEMSERFELDLSRGELPPELLSAASERLEDDARELQRAGRFAEALVRLEVLIGRDDDRSPIWRLRRAACLMQLERFTSAKEECERMLSRPSLDEETRIRLLEIHAICCYRLGKHAIALLALDEVGKLVDGRPDLNSLRAKLDVIRGNIEFGFDRWPGAVASYNRAIESFERLGDDHEACRARINLAAAHIESGHLRAAHRATVEALGVASRQRFDRQRAYALSHLGVVAFRSDDLQAAEGYCIQSNSIARPREYVSLVFRNAYYLWRIAIARNDTTLIRSHQRTLQTYLSRTDRSLREAREFTKSMTEDGE